MIQLYVITAKANHPETKCSGTGTAAKYLVSFALNYCGLLLLASFHVHKLIRAVYKGRRQMAASDIKSKQKRPIVKCYSTKLYKFCEAVVVETVVSVHQTS